MNATLATLFSPADRARLTDAVRLRTSCRHFAGSPSLADYAALQYAAGKYQLPGTRIVLTEVDDAVFAGTLLYTSRITGCRMAALLLASDTPNAGLHAGVLGECLTLEATALGLGACWVSGSYRRKALPDVAQPGETLLCIIAIGKPASPLTAPATRQRKPPERFCRGNFRAWPEMLQNAAALVQQAPSAMNMQPWTLQLGPNGEFILDSTDRIGLDAGIALCHAELALDIPHEWHYAAQRSDPTAWATAK